MSDLNINDMQNSIAQLQNSLKSINNTLDKNTKDKQSGLKMLSKIDTDNPRPISPKTELDIENIDVELINLMTKQAYSYNIEIDDKIVKTIYFRTLTLLDNEKINQQLKEYKTVLQKLERCVEQDIEAQSTFFRILLELHYASSDNINGNDIAEANKLPKLSMDTLKTLPVPLINEMWSGWVQWCNELFQKRFSIEEVEVIADELIKKQISVQQLPNTSLKAVLELLLSYIQPSQ